MSRRNPLRLLLFAVLLMALLVACGSADDPPAPTEASAPAELPPEEPPGDPAEEAPPAADEAVPVTIEGFQFEPATVEVPLGGTVMWTNLDDVNHTATSGATPDADGRFDTGALAQNASQIVTFDEAGSYTYFCTVHPNMTGTVVVGP